MDKRHVFLVTGRRLENGVPRGAIKTIVVCANGDEGVRRLIAERVPQFWITTITGLSAIEERAKKIRNTLSRTDTDWDVLVDPVFSEGG